MVDALAAAPRASRARSTRAPSLRAGSSSRSSTLSKPAVDVGEQRIYHMTHIDNLPGILSSGSLFSQAGQAEASQPAIDISSAPNRVSRTTIVVSDDGDSVASYVPFFLSTDATVWQNLRTRTADPRLAKAASGYAATEFVVLVSTIKAVAGGIVHDEYSGPAIAVTDGDATGALTRFATAPYETRRMLQTLRDEDEATRILDAEYLVHDAFPVELVTLIGVANVNVRHTVKTMLQAAAMPTKLVVHPPWFQPAEV
ncbi:DarT ssDNA thymidine ADP-ribosyltransferase family protein [Compostimonas suwonensis]|uniref:DarT ssDNA thymidine ADP-ribosyltransferase family protein n=1 Tax=Compostimonas suwonensis TaxID=1048394 RepID=UPI000C2356BF|nr:DarT ssDNA thymidine ADP-ribosyltransferase family protein [Compostimonas suwonensis]